MANVSKILLAYDRGQIASYKGKNLDEIQLDDVVEMDDAKVSDTAEVTKMNVHNQKVSVIVSFALHFLDFYQYLCDNSFVN